MDKQGKGVTISVRNDLGMNSSGDKGWCIIAPKEQCNSYRCFQ